MMTDLPHTVIVISTFTDLILKVHESIEVCRGHHGLPMAARGELTNRKDIFPLGELIVANLFSIFARLVWDPKEVEALTAVTVTPYGLGDSYQHFAASTFIVEEATLKTGEVSFSETLIPIYRIALLQVPVSLGAFLLTETAAGFFEPIKYTKQSPALLLEDIF
jgi:hypothetical protein